jgi:hypothetical protein
MPPVGFEPTISAGERPQTYALDRAASGTGKLTFSVFKFADAPPTYSVVTIREVRRKSELSIHMVNYTFMYEGVLSEIQPQTGT